MGYEEEEERKYDMFEREYCKDEVEKEKRPIRQTMRPQTDRPECRETVS